MKNAQIVKFLVDVFGFRPNDILTRANAQVICGLANDLHVSVQRERNGGLTLSIHIENIDESELSRFKEVQDLF